MSDSVTLRITQQKDYQFVVDFGGGLAPFVADQSAPLGTEQGPDPEQLLLAAVANCLAASLLFALRKFKQDPGKISATLTCAVGRNEKNRLRVQSIDATIELGKPGAEIEHLDRVLGQFEDFCTVSQSVQAGIPVRVHVRDSTGAVLK